MCDSNDGSHYVTHVTDDELYIFSHGKTNWSLYMHNYFPLSPASINSHNHPKLLGHHNSVVFFIVTVFPVGKTRRQTVTIFGYWFEWNSHEWKICYKLFDFMSLSKLEKYGVVVVSEWLEKIGQRWNWNETHKMITLIISTSWCYVFRVWTAKRYRTLYSTDQSRNEITF